MKDRESRRKVDLHNFYKVLNCVFLKGVLSILNVLILRKCIFLLAKSKLRD